MENIGAGNVKGTIVVSNRGSHKAALGGYLFLHSVGANKLGHGVLETHVSSPIQCIALLNL